MKATHLFFAAMLVIGIWCTALTQDTLIVFSPETFEQVMYVYDHEKGTIYQQPDIARTSGTPECLVLTLGKGRIFLMPAYQQTAKREQLETHLNEGPGLLRFDHCIDQQVNLESYEVRFVYDEDMGPVTLAKEHYEVMRSSVMSLHRLLYNATAVQIGAITAVTEDGQRMTLADIHITIE